MNRDRIQGNYKQFAGSAREAWGELTHNHMHVIEGRRLQLAGKIQKLYGIGRDVADRQIKDFARSVSKVSGTDPLHFETD